MEPEKSVRNAKKPNNRKHRRSSGSSPDRFIEIKTANNVPGSPVQLLSQLVTYDWSPKRVHSPKLMKTDHTPKINFAKISDSPDILSSKHRSVVSEARGFFKFVSQVKEKENNRCADATGSKSSYSNSDIENESAEDQKLSLSLSNEFNFEGELDNDDDLFPNESFEVHMSQLAGVPSETTESTKTVPVVEVTREKDKTKKSENDLFNDEFDESTDEIFADIEIDNIIANTITMSQDSSETHNKNSSPKSNTKNFIRHLSMPSESSGSGFRENRDRSTGFPGPNSVKIQSTKTFERHTSMPSNNQDKLGPQFSTFRSSNSVESIDSTSSSASSASTIQLNSFSTAVNDKSTATTSLSEEQRRIIAQKRKIAENLRNALKIREQKNLKQKR